MPRKRGRLLDGCAQVSFRRPIEAERPLIFAAFEKFGQLRDIRRDAPSLIPIEPPGRSRAERFVIYEIGIGERRGIGIFDHEGFR